jgi:hypothetical protein
MHFLFKESLSRRDVLCLEHDALVEMKNRNALEWSMRPSWIRVWKAHHASEKLAEFLNAPNKNIQIPFQIRRY